MTVAPRNIITKFQYTGDSGVQDVRSMVRDIVWTTEMKSAGTLNFTLLRGGSPSYRYPLKCSIGDKVIFEWNNHRIFYGTVFQRELDQDDNWRITAYDNMRYLKQTGVINFPVGSATDRFLKVMGDLNFEHYVVDAANYQVPAEICQGKTYFDMIQSAIDKTNTATNELFFLRDNGWGAIDLISTKGPVMSMPTVIGDRQGMAAFDFNTTIDNDTANNIVLVKQDQNNGQQVVATAKGDTIAKWGRLDDYEVVTDDMNPAQLQQHADDLLKQKNKETVTLKVTSLGDVHFRAGHQFNIKSLALNEAGSETKVYGEKVVQHFDTKWTMEIDVGFLT